MKKLFIFGIIAAIIGLAMYHPRLMLNPGTLVQAHAEIDNSCFSCHTPFKGISTENCIKCHKLADIGKEKSPTTGTKTKFLFHQNLQEPNCIQCHTDHKGRISSKERLSFSHELLAKEDANNCAACHQAPDDRMHPMLTSNTCISCHATDNWKNTRGFDHSLIPAGKRENCLACHQKPSDALHQGVTQNCIQCHSTSRWTPADFDHSAYFVLDRNHNASCKTCHTNNQFQSYTCYGCHEHTPSNILGEHREEGISNINDCVRCHKSGNEHDMEGRGEGRNSESGRENSGQEKEDDD